MRKLIIAFVMVSLFLMMFSFSGFAAANVATSVEDTGANGEVQVDGMGIGIQTCVSNPITVISD